MSVAVAVVNRRHAAIAADSVHLDVRSGRISDAGRKLAKSRTMLAALVGTSDFDGQVFVEDLQSAVCSAGSAPDVFDRFMISAGQHLAGAAHAWLALPSTTDLDGFLTIAVVEPGHRTGRCVIGRVTLDGTNLVMTGEEISRADPYVVAIGTTDRQLAAHTIHGVELARLTGTAAPRPAINRPAGRHRVETIARGLVDGAIHREQNNPRPAWWPDGAPVLAHPINAVSL